MLCPLPSVSQATLASKSEGELSYASSLSGGVLTFAFLPEASLHASFTRARRASVTPLGYVRDCLNLIRSSHKVGSLRRSTQEILYLIALTPMPFDCLWQKN